VKSKIIVGLLSSLLVLIIISLTLLSCDFTNPQKTFRLAVPKTEYFYNYIAGHLKPFLEKNGYQITIVPAENTLEANQMVVEGKAELAMVNNHSTTVALKLRDTAGQLRTIMPLTSRLLFVYSRNPVPDSTTAKKLLSGKRVGVEFLEGETHLTLKRFLGATKINNVTFTTFDDNPDVVIFWDRFYGERAASWSKKGWHPYSFRKNFLEFIMLNDHSLKSFRLPAVPGDTSSIVTNTLITDVILVANKNLGENACYLLAHVFYQNKVDLLHQDIMYRSISENFDKEKLLFPLHNGTNSYLLRDQPSFFERYSESFAFGLSFLAIVFGAVQAVQSKLRRNQKENIDKYFLEFLEIRAHKDFSRDERARKLDDIFERAVIQLTKNKLDRSDFHILSRLLQQELTMLRFNSSDEKIPERHIG
jgi:TRAP-type uncharacterized transport system substrate-binding protein